MLDEKLNNCLNEEILKVIRGTHLLKQNNEIVFIEAADSICPTNDHTPKPLYANKIPIKPLVATATKDIIA